MVGISPIGESSLPPFVKSNAAVADASDIEAGAVSNHAENPSSILTTPAIDRFLFYYVDSELEKEYISYLTEKVRLSFGRLNVVFGMYLVFCIVHVMLFNDFDSKLYIMVCLFIVLGVIPCGIFYRVCRADSFHNFFRIIFFYDMIVFPYLLVTYGLVCNQIDSNLVIASQAIILLCIPVYASPPFRWTLFVSVTTCLYFTIASFASDFDDITKERVYDVVLVLAISGIVLYSNYISDKCNRKEFNQSRNMKRKNEKLTSQLRIARRASRRKISEDVDLDSRLDKMIKFLKQFSEENGYEGDIVSQADSILHSILSGPNILMPNLSNELSGKNKNVDQEVTKYLFYEVGSRENNNVVRIDEIPSTPVVFTKRRVTFVDDSSPRASRVSLAVNMDSISQFWDESDKWNLDMFQLCKITSGRPIYAVGFFLFHKLRLIHEFNIEEDILASFLTEVENSYLRENYFHNNTHAADVTFNIFHLISSSTIANYITPLETLACLFAALIHDVKHPGLNNAFQINAQSDLAILYNDRSVLENHHISTAFQMIRKPEFNIFKNLTKSQYKELRDLVIEMVLATDMAFHFDHVSSFKGKLSSGGFDYSRKSDRLVILRTALKCADIGHTTKNLKLHFEWTRLINEEFFSQGDLETKMNLPLSPFMGRRVDRVNKSQMTFINFVVLPLWDAWAAYDGRQEQHILQLKQNYNEWMSRNERSVAFSSTQRRESNAPGPTRTMSNAAINSQTDQRSETANHSIANRVNDVGIAESDSAERVGEQNKDDDVEPINIANLS